MKYTVKKITEDFAVDGNPGKEQWQEVKELTISSWPWHDYSKYPTPEVSAKCFYSDNGIYVLFSVKERFVLAKHTKYQESVWQDSCIEFFVAPTETGYFNFEINCIGTLLLHWNDLGGNHLEIPLDHIKNLKIRSSLGCKAIETPAPCPMEGYAVECFIPFSVFRKFTHAKAPATNTCWQANFYKCGDSTPEPAWGSWSPIDQPQPSFHHPECFGELIFE